MAAAAAGSPEPTKVLGKGGFGVVFTPAMNNINASGTRTSFPGHVTKFFFRKDKYEKALRDAEELQKKVPALAIPYSPYEHQYKTKDLPISVIASLTRENVPGMKRGHPAYILRMPNLGVSIHDFANDPALQERYKRAVPFEKKVQEIYKLMTIVKAIGDAGLIHGDIRETNLLVNVDTGDMTIIDFDLMMPKTEFLRKARHPFYSFPPEMTYLCTQEWNTFRKKYMGEIKQSGFLLEGFPDAGRMRTILTQVYTKRWPRDILGEAGSMIYQASDYYYTLLQNLRKTFEAGAASETDLEEIMTPTEDTVDSYGLGYALAVFFLYALKDYSQDDSPLKWFLRTAYLSQMMHPDPTKRMSIGTMMSVFKQYIQTQHGQRKGTPIEFPPDTPAARVAVLTAEVERLEEMDLAAGGVGAVAAAPVLSAISSISRRGSAAATRTKVSSSSTRKHRSNKSASK